jgi:phosphatidylethanolamine-binding protein (PEBP) family uncharacterized protein
MIILMILSEDKMRSALICLLGLAIATPALADMSASFDWGPTKKCFDTRSPPFSVSGVPAGTAKLDFRMQDRDAMSFQHGGGKVAYTGKNAVPYGAFRYNGPCPPAPATHTYRFTVKALDTKGKTLASTTAEKTFHQ